MSPPRRALVFDKDAYTELTTTVRDADGTDHTVVYHFWKAITYVASPVDAKYQSLNVSVPVKIDGKAVDATNAPIVFADAVGGYMPSSVADATGVGGSNVDPGDFLTWIARGDGRLQAGARERSTVPPRPPSPPRRRARTPSGSASRRPKGSSPPPPLPCPSSASLSGRDLLIPRGFAPSTSPGRGNAGRRWARSLAHRRPDDHVGYFTGSGSAHSPPPPTPPDQPAS